MGFRVYTQQLQAWAVEKQCLVQCNPCQVHTVAEVCHDHHHHVLPSSFSAAAMLLARDSKDPITWLHWHLEQNSVQDMKEAPQWLSQSFSSSTTSLTPSPPLPLLPPLRLSLLQHLSLCSSSCELQSFGCCWCCNWVVVLQQPLLTHGRGRSLTTQ